ncbi:MAG TPA: hypothetical protein VK508_13915 [Cyclobacteriaceae bacterium]|nr:hypothetical protein [Cyclobacteriaceae bacterium]
MKTLLSIILIAFAIGAKAQPIVGKWQLSEQKTCFQAEMKESETEKELSSSMGSTSNTAVARVMTLEDDGKGEEGIFSAGKKKATSKNAFRYQVSEAEFFILDKKSGLVTQRWVIDELTDTSLKMHDAVRDCETKTYIKVK